MQLRRLVVGEANRVPALAQLYYEQAPARTLAAFADCFGGCTTAGLLHVPEPALAAEHFAFLIVGRCIDQALFCGGPQVLAEHRRRRATSARACRCFSPVIGHGLRR